MYPIWRDKYREIATYVDGENEVVSFVYSIGMLDGYVKNETTGALEQNIITIFNGKAWNKPKEANIYIKLNDICRDYLKSDLPDLRTITEGIRHHHPDSAKQFILYDGNNNIIERFQFGLDWSYDETPLNSDYQYAMPITYISKPINGRAVEGMYCIQSRLDLGYDGIVSYIAPSAGELNDLVREAVYTEIENCKAEYALYYLNRYGGWDCFLIEGNVKKKDTYSKYYVDKVYDNRTLDFGKRVYHNEIKTSYELHTSWLNDTQSDNLAFNLLSSNMVYLHHIITGDIMPVVITDAEAQYKTFRNQGNKLCNYTINVECSQKQHNL